MLKLHDCQTCGAPLGSEDVQKTQTVRESYTAVKFTCPHCRASCRQVFEQAAFTNLLTSYEDGMSKVDLMVEVFKFDLEGIDNVKQFMAYAGSRNVPREGNGRGCGCGRCGN